jgi:hypothetical protein
MRVRICCSRFRRVIELPFGAAAAPAGGNVGGILASFSIVDRCAAELCVKIERDGGFFMLDRHASRL